METVPERGERAAEFAELLEAGLGPQRSPLHRASRRSSALYPPRRALYRHVGDVGVGDSGARSGASPGRAGLTPAVARFVPTAPRAKGPVPAPTRAAARAPAAATCGAAPV